MLDAAHNALRYCWQYEDKGRALANADEHHHRPWPTEPFSLSAVAVAFAASHADF